MRTYDIRPALFNLLDFIAGSVDCEEFAEVFIIGAELLAVLGDKRWTVSHEYFAAIETMVDHSDLYDSRKCLESVFNIRIREV